MVFNYGYQCVTGISSLRVSVLRVSVCYGFQCLTDISVLQVSVGYGYLCVTVISALRLSVYYVYQYVAVSVCYR